MKHHFLIYLFAFSLFFSSCQTLSPRKWTSQDLIIDDQASLSFAEKLTPGQVAEDIDFLIYALTTGYGGRNYVPKDYFSDAIKSLKAISHSSNIQQLHEQLDEALFHIPDNHLKAYYRGKTSQKRLSQFQAGGVGTNNISNSQKVWEVRMDKVEKKKVLYISIKYFPNKNSEVWKGFISSVSSQLKKSDSIVLDLRGNSGGDDSIGMELAKLLFGHPIEHPIKRQYRSQTPESFALFVTADKVKLINMQHLGEKIPGYLTEYLRESKELYGKAIKGELPKEFIRTDKGTGSRTDPITGYKKPIYILMDRACESSCEFTVAAFEWHNYVKRVGENTAGTFHFSNPGMAILPNSKIKVMIPTQFSEYFDLRFIERIGFSPDIKVYPGDDAYVVVKKMIGGKD